MKNDKLKIGLLTDSHIIPAWIFDCLNEIRESGHSELSLILFHDSGRKHSKSTTATIRKHAQNLVLNAYKKFEQAIFHPKPNAFENKDLKTLTKNLLPVIDYRSHSPDKQKTNTIIEKIRAHQLDVIIKPGPEPVDSNLANCAKHGVWTFHPATDADDVQDTAAFSEVLKAQGTTYIKLLTISEPHQTSKVIHTSSFCTNENSVNWNRHFFFWKARSILPRNLELLHRQGPQKFFSQTVTHHEKTGEKQPKDYNLKGNAGMLIQIAGLFVRYVKRKITALFWFEQWILLFSNTASEPGSISIENFKRIIPGKDRLWADPFIIDKGGSSFVFFEELIYKEQKGRIAVMEIDKTGVCHKPQTALERDHHLSYPFLFEEKGKLYMLPESSMKQSVDLYQCTDFPLGWEYRVSLLNNVEAADATLLKHNGKYWLFAAMRENPATSINDNLFLFSSNNLESSTWKPHPMNPIVSDVKTSRPGGKIFKKDGRIFRPAQNASNYYGYGLNIMEIIKLSEDEYEEKHVQFIQARGSDKFSGVHTYNYSGQMTVMDALIKRKKFRK